MEAHGGKIWAKNNSNDKVATFAFSLPLIIQKDHHPQESRDINTTMINDMKKELRKSMMSIAEVIITLIKQK